MPKNYSLDLRQKVMQFYTESQHKSKTCRTFNIARSTLDDWILLEKNTGQLKQQKSDKVGRPKMIKDWEAFKLFVEMTPFNQAKELVPLFELKFGYPISYAVILLGLHRLGWSQKRATTATSKRRKLMSSL